MVLASQKVEGLTKTKINRAVFLDRDGTIIEDRDYLSEPEEVKLIAGSIEAIKMINDLDFKTIVVTNQSGVARGYFPEKNIAIIHDKLSDLLSSGDANIDGYYYCPHHPTKGKGKYLKRCDCRKPETGMLDEAVNDFDLDSSTSYMIGDKLIDVEMAERAGAKGILVKTGYGMKELKAIESGSKIRPVFIADNILDALKWIKKEENKL